MMLSLTLSVLSLVLLSMSFKDDLKGREPVIYLRVSTKAQRSTLKAQRKTCEDWLKQQGITRKVRVYEEIIPGTAEDPPELLNAVGYCASKPGKCFLLVRDYQRISRNWRFGGMNLVPLFNADIPVVSVLRNQVSGTAKTTREGDWLIGLLMAIGAQESDQIKARTEAGTIVAQEKGIFSGSPPKLFPEENLNPYRELVRLLAAGVGQNEGARRLGRATSWWRKRRLFLADVRERGGDDLVEQWLDTTDRIRAIQRGLGKSKEDKKRERAVLRMTSGFLQQPYNFPVPTDADLAEYVTNFKAYLPSRKKK